jgi:RimJ/RimL family protein N-acetyltransferase
MQLRMLEADDLEPLAKLYTYYATQTVFTYYACVASPKYMRSLFAGVGHACAVAVEDGKVIGYVHISPMDTNIDHSSMAVYLAPEFTGQRRGERMVYFGEKMASDLCYRYVDIGICTENEHSRRLFERLGYTYIGLQRAESVKFGRILDTASYRKTINP